MGEEAEQNPKHQIHHHHPFFGLVFIIWALAGLLVIVFAWSLAELDIERLGEVADVTRVLKLKREKPPAQTAKGLYLTAYSANNPDKINEIISLLSKTELNSVVIDIKDYSGYILYDSNVKVVNKLKTEDVRIKNPEKLIDQLHKNNIYVIARQTVMQDPVLALSKPEWAIKNKSGGIWKDHKGLSWVDPTKKEVWGYNLSIAREAIDLGFDEINFDYVRFPSDGNLDEMVFASGTKKYQVMEEFYKYISDGLKDEPAWISLDLFGFVMDKTGEDDMNIGQRLADAAPHTDYVSPMMYPSHYPKNYLGFKNPADHPFEVIENGIKKGLPKLENKRAKLRPWIQAFNVGAVYDAAKIRAQIDAIEKYPNAGWLLWNASNRYSAAGLASE